MGVDDRLLAERGAVDPQVAEQLAEGARVAFTLDGVAADMGISTTGVAGPDPQDGQPVGTVFVGVAIAGDNRVCQFLFDGDRASIRAATVQAALSLALEMLGASGE